MKKYLNLTALAAIAAALTFTACSSNEELANEPPFEPTPVSFNAGFKSMAVTRTQVSATAQPTTGNFSIDDKWNTGNVLALYMHDADSKWYLKSYTTGSSASENAAATLTAAGTDATKDFYWKNTSEVKIFEAYSFGTNDPIANGTAVTDADNTTAGGVTIAKFSVNSDQSESNKEFLYNYGAIKYDANSNTKEIKLNHQLARIDIVLITPKSYTLGDAAARASVDKQITIGNADSKIALAGTFAKPTAFTTYLGSSPTVEDLTKTDKGTWTPSVDNGDQGYITPRVLVAEAAISDNTYGAENNGKYVTTYSAVVVPQDFFNKKMFVITYDGATYAYTGVAAVTTPDGTDNSKVGTVTDAKDNLGYIEATDGTSSTNGAGKKYTYKIVIGPTALSVTSSINDWDDEDQGSASATLE